MEILKKITVALLIVLSTVSYSQNNEKLQEAFKKSYDFETQGNYNDAIRMMKDVYQEDSYEVNLRLGWLNYLSGLFNESTPYYSKCISLVPLSIEARLGIVNPLAAMGNWAQVESMYKEILEMDPENTTANYRLGVIYYGKEDYKKALNYFNKIINHFPFDYDTVIMVAWTNYRIGDYRKAKILFNKALLIRSYDASALEGLSLIANGTK